MYARSGQKLPSLSHTSGENLRKEREIRKSDCAEMLPGSTMLARLINSTKLLIQQKVRSEPHSSCGSQLRRDEMACALLWSNSGIIKCVPRYARRVSTKMYMTKDCPVSCGQQYMYSLLISLSATLSFALYVFFVCYDIYPVFLDICYTRYTFVVRGPSSAASNLISRMMQAFGSAENHYRQLPWLKDSRPCMQSMSASTDGPTLRRPSLIGASLSKPRLYPPSERSLLERPDRIEGT
jgi:hypothetical protein